MKASTTNTLIGAGAGVATGILGMLGQKKREKRAVENQKTLMDWQKKNQRELNQQGADLQYDMWKKTNYPAQMEMIKEAGLNPALLYGMSGGGGTTTGSQGGGSASGGQAPAPQPMELGTALQAAQMAENLKLVKAQRRNLNAQAEEQELDNQTKKLYGQNADMAEAHNRHNKAISDGKMLYGEWADKDGGYKWLDSNTDPSNRAEQMILNDFTVQEVERKLAEEQDKVRKERVAYQLLNTKLDAEVKKANIDLTREQERKLWHDIWQGWTNAGLKGLDTIIKGRLKDIGKGK